MSPAPAADPLFGAAWAAIGLARPTRPWTLPVVNGLAVAAIIGAVAYRIWEARPPAEVLREEAILIGIGVVFAAVAVWLKASPRGSSLLLQLPVMATATVLTVLVMWIYFAVRILLGA